MVLREGDVTEEEYDAFKTAIKNDGKELGIPDLGVNQSGYSSIS